jgi:hypothetical protein
MTPMAVLLPFALRAGDSMPVARTEPLFNGGHWVPDLLEIAGTDYSLAKAKERSGES